MKTINLTSTNHLELSLFDRDIWKAEEIGLPPDTVHSTYHLNFSKLKPDWFKNAVKRFIRFQAATKSFSSCYSYIVQLNQFSAFITASGISLSPKKINRSVIVQYITYLAQSKLSITARSMALIHLRTFHGIVTQEGWLPWPKEPIIYSSDLPKNLERIPRFIPEYVLTQLQQKLHRLPQYLQHLVIVLLETGRRIGEVCTLPFDCIEHDDQGDSFLKVHEKKLKKTYLIPISEACIKAIQSQQELVRKNIIENKNFLFPTERRLKKPHVSARNVHYALNKLSTEHKIVDEHHKRWNFHAHQFRHTVGTPALTHQYVAIIKSTA